MAEGVAVVIAEGAFRGSTNVGENERRGSLRGNSLEVDAVPSWSSRCENAWLGAQFTVCVVSYAKAIAVVWSPAIQTEAGVERLR